MPPARPPANPDCTVQNWDLGYCTLMELPDDNAFSHHRYHYPSYTAHLLTATSFELFATVCEKRDAI